ncbi:MAG: hypothetical protein ABFR19_06645 [Pseudomonadota bacterium]
MNAQESRHYIATEAAKLLAQQQILDYGWARNKAADAVGIHGERFLPDFAQIEAALTEYLELFHPQHNAAEELQRKSLELMNLLLPFQPHLSGALSRGIAARHAAITLYLYADSPKEVVFSLIDLNASYESLDVRLTFQRGKEERRPAFRINFDGSEFVLVVLRLQERRHPPIDPVTGNTERGLDVQALQMLIES